MRNQTITISKEVDVEIELDEIMEHLDTDDLLDGLDSDDILNHVRENDIIDYAAANCDTDRLLDVVWDCDIEGFTDWVKSHPECVTTAKEGEKEEKEEAIPLYRPVVVMEKGEVRQVSQADPTIAHTYGTYTVFNNMVCVNAYGTEFVVSSIKDATQVLNALAFMTFNPKQEV